MPKVTLDVTGFYFQHEVDIPANSSVKDLMTAVQSATAGGDPQFTFQAGGDYLDSITIIYKTSPASRQDPNRRYGPGVYTYDDSYDAGANPIHAWQYYITDENGVLVSGPDKNGKRTIVPFSQSNAGANGEPGIQFKDGFRVTWRLVAILVGPNGGDIKKQAALAKA